MSSNLNSFNMQGSSDKNVQYATASILYPAKSLLSVRCQTEGDPLSHVPFSCGISLPSHLVLSFVAVIILL